MALNAVLVGSINANDDGPITSVSGTTTASGSSFLVGVSYGYGRNCTGVTDSKGNTYTQLGTKQANGDTHFDFWFCEGGTGGTSHTATASFSATGSFPTIYFIEITSAAGTVPALDV